MQEKHTTETGTLLAALVDAQQNAQSLRAENAKLVVEDLEAELVDARVQLRAHQYASAGATSSPPSSYSPALCLAGWSAGRRRMQWR
jgi:ABC-type nitrate/sulfonate/bicarbonate transport system substrate-binding protein